jgi:cytochrome c oxidase subunit 1
VATMLIGIPTGVKIFNWIATMYGGSLRFPVSMKFAIGLIAMFTIGGISGVMHSSPPSDLQQTDTYFIVAHFHYVLYGGAMMGIFAGIYHYFPKITGRFMSEKLGNWQFWLNFVGLNLTFFPMHFSGMLGMPRRIYTYDAGQGWDLFNLMSTTGTYMLLVAGLIFAWNFFSSRRNGPVAGNDPWGAPTLEWSIPSPPPEYNFAQIPEVTSRSPLWDLKAPDRTEGIAHSHADAGVIAEAHAVPVHEETERRTAKELGIPMPFNTIKPFMVALGIVILFSGLIVLHAGYFALAMATMLGGGAFMVGSLYAWLTSPLE